MTVAEQLRLDESHARQSNWQRWGPYLSERQWGTVREDYSEHGNCWDYFSHDQSRSRAYRWGEDGLLGITDRQCRLCFAIAMWNGKDPILKERLFGLTGPEGNHGEDVKECYYYLDSTPTHSYMKALYKYPQTAFPYSQLVEENRRRGKLDPEFELRDAGVFHEDRYFDVFVEYAKAAPDDVGIRLTIANRGPEPSTIHVLPTLWFRNTWSWGCKHEGCWVKPAIWREGEDLLARHATLQPMRLQFEPAPDGTKPTLLFTENESNLARLFGSSNASPHVKDAFHDYVIHGRSAAVNPRQIGTKAAGLYQLVIPAGGEVVLRMRLSPLGMVSTGATTERAMGDPDQLETGRTRHRLQTGATLDGLQTGSTVVRLRAGATPDRIQSGVTREAIDTIFADRLREADEFYTTKLPSELSPEKRQVARQAYAGLLWTKQFFHYIVRDWLDGDPDQPQPPENRARGRNNDWTHLYNRDIISMPDKWEYPWYAAWDLAFHMLPFARIDVEFAKQQLLLFLREWYMHPNGQIPAYEFALGDVNPPVHAWACWRVYKMSGPRGERDRLFLKRVFQKLLINFTWWVNRKDPDGKNLFAGGFLGMDNIGVFDRSQPLPTGGHLEQADGTAWMAFYCATMLSMALELASEDPEYEDVASKFFEHFVTIADAMNTLGGTGLWDEQDGFYYDQIHVDGRCIPMRLRSMVGLAPLFAVEILEAQTIDKLPGFRRRMQWFLEHRRDLAKHIAYMEESATSEPGVRQRRTTGSSQVTAPHAPSTPHAHYLLAIPTKERLQRVLRYALDENELLSPYGMRSLSRIYKDRPYEFHINGNTYSVDYVPGEGNTGLFGGNSNWRGPVWFPMNYLLVEALERYHHFYGDDFKVECPVGSGNMLNLKEVAQELAGRLARIFLPDAAGRRPFQGDDAQLAADPHWRDLVLFHEYFNGDTGQGTGASHQTGWTALVIRCLEDLAAQRRGQTTDELRHNDAGPRPRTTRSKPAIAVVARAPNG